MADGVSEAADLRRLEGDCIRLSEALDDVRTANAELSKEAHDGAHWEAVADRMRDEITRLSELLRYEHSRANSAIDREETAELAAEESREEAERLRSAWRSARRRAKTMTGAWRYLRWQVQSQREEARKQGDFAAWLWGEMSERRQERDRFRLAWLSARRRAADEHNFGVEALDLIRADRDRERRESTRLRAFADEVKGVHNSCRDGEPDCAERFLRRVYDSMYELWDAQRDKRPFVGAVCRRAARGDFDDVIEADDVRESTHGPSRLEEVGTEEDGGTVWQLLGTTVEGADVYIAPVSTPTSDTR